MDRNHPYLARIDRILEEQGGLYTFDDLLDEVAAGTAQSWAEGDSMVITSIRTYPRKTICEVRLAVGTLPEIYRMQPRVVAFAIEHNCDLILAGARVGWEGVKTPAWDAVPSTLYIRRLSSAAR